MEGEARGRGHHAGRHRRDTAWARHDREPRHRHRLRGRRGIHGALSEAIHYDSEGQLLTGTLLDYALPTAAMCPNVEIAHLESPSPLNPFGVKGLGEGGAIAPPVAIANAVSDALGIEINDLPVRCPYSSTI
jgi:hypothetical protein